VNEARYHCANRPGAQIRASTTISHRLPETEGVLSHGWAPAYKDFVRAWREVCHEDDDLLGVASVLDAVVNDREEVVITRVGHEPAVIVSLEDYESLKETAYLLRSPENARRLLASIDRLENGGGTARDLLE
jgi:antitoxin YefM